MSDNRKQYFAVGDKVNVIPQHGHPPLPGTVTELKPHEMLAIKLDNGTKATACWPFVLRQQP